MHAGFIVCRRRRQRRRALRHGPTRTGTHTPPCQGRRPRKRPRRVPPTEIEQTHGEDDPQDGDKHGDHDVGGCAAATAISLSRSSLRRIFSALLFGNSSRNVIDRGIVCAASSRRQWAIRSSAPTVCPGLMGDSTAAIGRAMRDFFMAASCWRARARGSSPLVYHEQGGAAALKFQQSVGHPPVGTWGFQKEQRTQWRQRQTQKL